MLHPNSEIFLKNHEMFSVFLTYTTEKQCNGKTDGGFKREQDANFAYLEAAKSVC